MTDLRTRWGSMSMAAVIAITVALFTGDSSLARQPVSSPEPATPPAAPPTPKLPAEVTKVPAPGAGDAIPQLADALADVEAGGIGEALSRVPNFIGDGCAPGAGTSRLPIGRLAAVTPGFISGTNTNTIGGGTADVYQLPTALNSIQALQTSGSTGFPPPGTFTGAAVGGPTEFVIANPDGGPGSIVQPGTNFTDTVNGVFQTRYPGSQNGVTVFAPDASGFLVSGSNIGNVYAFYDYVVDTAVLMPGANVGFVKLSENVSPLPRDRVYFNYSYFYNALLGPTRGNVNRFTPGFEKTFADGWTSIEVRTPFAATLANMQTLDPTEPCGIGDAQAVEFGNMSVIFKSVIGLGRSWAWTGGMQVMIPTAGDVVVNSAAGGPAAVRIDNQSVRLMPFMAGIWAPNDVWFGQALLQMDTAANGNPAFLAVPGQTGLQNVGQLQYPTFMYLSFNAGYWAYRSNSSRFTGFAPIAEIHVNQAMQASDVIEGSQYRLGADSGVVSLVNGLVGCNFEWGTRSTLTFAYVTPLGGGVDRWFDGELRAFWNWRFGPQNRLTRVQF